MQAIDGMTANSNAHLSSLSDIISALQAILARSQVTIPDLETPCSRVPNTNQSAIHSVQIIRAIIAKRQQQLDTVSHELLGLESVMGSIEDLRQQLVDKKNMIAQSLYLHKGLVSGLWRLPTEILSQIFYYCLPESNYPSALRAPLLLTGVCRRWREVVLDMPSLWCRLSVMVALSCKAGGRRRRLQWKPQASGYDLWLKRSRGRPLSLALYCNTGDATNMQSLLQPYVKQILSLRLTFYEGTTQPELLLDDLPALQELAILQGIQDSDVEIPAIGKSIPRVPSTVRSLKISDLFFHTVPLTSFGPVAAHLTNLDIGTLRHPSAVLQLLHLCPNLASLNISVTFDDEEAVAFQSFTHTKIQKFRIAHASFVAHHLSALLDALSFPSLRVLEYYLDGGPPCSHEQWKALLARSKCPLETLIFSGWETPTVTDVERAEYIALIPSLDILVVDPRTT